MKRTLVAALLLFVLVVPAVAKTHKDVYNVTCTTLWPAVKDVLRNSGKYGIIGIDNTEMTASYNIGGYWGGKRINSLVLNPQGNTCELQVQTSFSGLAHDDAGDFKKRVDDALAKQAAQPTPPAQPAASGQPVPSVQPAPGPQPTPPAQTPAPSDQPVAPQKPADPSKR